MKKLLVIAAIGVAGLVSANESKENSQKTEMKTEKTEVSCKSEDEALNEICFCVSNEASCGIVYDNCGYCYTEGNVKSYRAAMACAIAEYQALDEFICS